MASTRASLSTIVASMANVDTPLTREEFTALREVSWGQAQRSITPYLKARLIELGFLEQRSLGPVLTRIGRLRLAKGK